MNRNALRPAFAVAWMAFAMPAQGQDFADRIWSGGTVLTMNDKAMRAEAVDERRADRAGAEFCGRPLDLASALQKLDAAARRIPMPVAPSYAPMAQVDPLQAYGRGVPSLFSTHPPMAERVARLQAIAGEPLRRPTAA